MESAVDLIRGTPVFAVDYEPAAQGRSALVCPECSEEVTFVQTGEGRSAHFRHREARHNAPPCHLRALDAGASATPGQRALRERPATDLKRLADLLTNDLVHKAARGTGFMGIESRLYAGAWRDNPYALCEPEQFFDGLEPPMALAMVGRGTPLREALSRQFASLTDSPVNEHLFTHLTRYRVAKPHRRRIIDSMVAMAWAGVAGQLAQLADSDGLPPEAERQLAALAGLLARPGGAGHGLLEEDTLPMVLALCEGKVLSREVGPAGEFGPRNRDLLRHMVQVMFAKFVLHLPLSRILTNPAQVLGEGWGYVYIATTPTYRHANRFKVGRAGDVLERMRTLSSAGLLEDFEDVHYVLTPDPVRLEREVHDALAGCRVRKDREFFEAPLGRIRRTVDELARKIERGPVERSGAGRQAQPRKLTEHEARDKISALQQRWGAG